MFVMHVKARMTLWRPTPRTSWTCVCVEWRCL